MAVTGDVAAVVKIVEDAKLFCEGMLVRSDVRPVHGEGGIAVADSEVAKNLIVGAVFLDDVDDVLDFVFAGREGNSVGIAAAGIAFRNFFRVGIEVRGNFREGQARQRAANQSQDVRIFGSAVQRFSDGF